MRNASQWVLVVCTMALAVPSAWGQGVRSASGKLLNEGMLAEGNDRLKEALDAYQKGYEASRLERAAAIKRVQQGRAVGADEVRPKIEFLMYIGRVQRRLGQLADAFRSYEEYQEQLDGLAARDAIPKEGRWDERAWQGAARLNEELRKAAAVEQADLRQKLASLHIEALDKALEDRLRKDDKNAGLVLLRGVTQRWLGRNEPALELLERYQRLPADPKVTAANEARVRRAYEGLGEAFAKEYEQVKDKGDPKVPPRALLLMGRVHVGLFRLEHQVESFVGVERAEEAVERFNTYRRPDPTLYKGEPPRDATERMSYETAARSFVEVYKKKEQMRRLPLFIGRAYFLAGQPKEALRWHGGLQVEPRDERTLANYLKEERIGDNRTRNILIAVGAVAVVGLAVGLGAGLGARGDGIQEMPF